VPTNALTDKTIRAAIKAGEKSKLFDGADTRHVDERSE